MTIKNFSQFPILLNRRLKNQLLPIYYKPTSLTKANVLNILKEDQQTVKLSHKLTWPLN